VDGGLLACLAGARELLAWEIDAEQSIDLAVAYKAGRYRLKPFQCKGSRSASDYPRYAVYFDEWGYPARYALHNGGASHRVGSSRGGPVN
jgi:hypothetical protein